MALVRSTVDTVTLSLTGSTPYRAGPTDFSIISDLTSVNDLDSESSAHTSSGTLTHAHAKLQEYSGIIDRYISEGRSRDLDYIDEHIALSQRRLTELQKHRRSHTSPYNHAFWEAKIWRLVRKLHIARHNNETAVVSDCESYFNPQYSVNTQCNNDTNSRVLSAIIEWLEDECEAPQYFNQGSAAFHRTLREDAKDHHIKLQSLDPDVLTREKVDLSTIKSHQMKDLRDEDALLYNVRRLIRKGLWKEAKELCQKFGHSWRAASLNGGFLISDSMELDQADKMQGNSEWLLWLQSCQLLAQKSQSVNEQWIYSVCCGRPNILVTEAQKNWEDMLWALCVCKNQTEREAVFKSLNSWYSMSQTAKLTKSKLKIKPVLSRQWKQRLSDLKSVFDYIDPQIQFQHETPKKHISESRLTVEAEYTTTYANQYYKICKFLMLGDNAALMEDCFNFVASMATKQISGDYMRLVLHLYLCIFPNVNGLMVDEATRRAETPEDDMNTTTRFESPSARLKPFVSAYIHELVDKQQYDVVAKYCLVLSRQGLVSCYVDFLSSLEEEKHRLRKVELLHNMTDTFPHPLATEITHRIADHVISEPAEVNQLVKVCQDLDTKDREKIDVLRCLIDAQDELQHCCKCCNQVFAQFARDFKESGIIELWETISSRQFVMLVEGQVAIQTSWHYHYNTLKSWELLYYVIQWMHTWRAHFDDRPSTDTTDAAFERWQIDADKNREMLFAATMQMLTYEKGWLSPNNCAISQWRHRSIKKLRGVVLARILNQVLHICFQTHSYHFCMDLMRTVADENHRLYECLAKETLRQLMSHAQKAQIYLLEAEQQSRLLYK